MTNRDRQPDQSFSRRHLLQCGGVVSLTVLLFAVTNGVVSAEPPQRNRTLNYEPVSAQQPSTSQSHVANYPAPEPQNGSSTPRSSGSRSRSGTEDFLDPSLPEPGGRIDDIQAQAALDKITRKTLAAKTGETTNPSDISPGTPPTDGTGNVPSNSGIVMVERIVKIDDDWFAFKEGSKIPIPVVKSGDRYFTLDGNQEVMRPDAPAVIDEPTKENAKTTLADDQTRNALLLIVTTMAVLAALGIGILAFDYKHRWEQEIVSQNNRLLGNGATQGTFAELDSLEPETLRFSPHDYGSLDNSFDHTFRTIA